MRISKTACRKKQDDRLQSGDGRFLYSWYNYTICNREIFRRSGGLPPQARLAADGQAGHCRRLAAETRGDVGHLRFPMSPLDTPLTFREPRLPAVARRNGGYEGSVPCVGQILGRFVALSLPCVICRAYQCAARQCRALDLCCEKLRFDQGCALGAPDAPVGPSHLDARPKGVAS